MPPVAPQTASDTLPAGLESGPDACLGLFAAADFEACTGDCRNPDVVPQALWLFSEEFVVVPKPDLPLAAYSPDLPLDRDLADWTRRVRPGEADDRPALIWLAARDVVRDARLAGDGQSFFWGASGAGLRLVEQLPLNGAYFDRRSVSFFQGVPLKLRGTWQGADFVARVFWPQSHCLPASVPQQTVAADPLDLRAWVRQGAGADTAFSASSAWRRDENLSWHAGQPVLGLILNGAQGDDDEAHAGHVGLVTGRIGEAGAMDDWLVNNFYTLDSVSEKGIIAAPVPLDNYLGDLNSGQAWYRPSWMLVARLRSPRAASYLQSALGRVFNQFYRRQFAYQHARNNCAGISVSAARAIGWQVPVRGAESWWKAILALPVVAWRERSLKKGKAACDYLSEDLTRLFPAAAFEEMGADLMRLATGTTQRPLSEFERCLAEDIEEILLVRLPQWPSSRASGSFPVASSAEYETRLPADRSQMKIIPVPARPFPEALRDPRSPAEPPLHSDYALAAWILAATAMILAILGQLLA